MTTLQLNTQGAEVKALQNQLIQLGYQITPDGIYGNQTLNAVLAFQKQHQLMPDGVVGPITQSVITASIHNPTMQGIDVSSNNHLINWNAVKLDNHVQFTIAKATEGATYTDPLFKGNFAQMQHLGMPYGAYHFFRFFTSDPLPQAANFTNIVGATNLPKGSTFAPIVDVEYQDSKGLTNPQVIGDRVHCAQKLKTFIDQITTNFGRTPIIYTNADFWNNVLGAPTGFEQYPLWVADYEHQTAPALPKGWAKQLIWQHLATGTISGINGNVDMNIFNGDAAALKAALNS
jgi:lysozyme